MVPSQTKALRRSGATRHLGVLRRTRPLPMSEIHAALTGSMIEARYQPIVRLSDRRPVAVEALARMNHPARGTLLPHRFVPQMEDAGLAPALTEAVTKRAFADLSGAPLTSLALQIALNFPLDVLLVRDALLVLDAQRQKAGIRPEQVIIELTESQPVEDVPALGRAIERLRKAGYGVAIDDIQPAVPHLKALLELPFSSVKLDKGVVQSLASDMASRGFTKDVVSLAQSRGLTVTAEGVEDAATWDRLVWMGVEQAQGFLIARPLIAMAVPVWLRRWTAEQRPD